MALVYNTKFVNQNANKDRCYRILNICLSSHTSNQKYVNVIIYEILVVHKTMNAFYLKLRNSLFQNLETNHKSSKRLMNLVIYLLAIYLPQDFTPCKKYLFFSIQKLKIPIYLVKGTRTNFFMKFKHWFLFLK